MDPITIGIACWLGWAAHCNDKVLAAEAAAQVATTTDLEDSEELPAIAFCRECSEEVNEDGSFCHRCGTLIE